MDIPQEQTSRLADLICREFVGKINHIAIEAGALISDIYRRKFDIDFKSDHSPLTEADLASHHCIVKALSELTPELPVLSEESADVCWAERSQWQTYWLIDPLDGTKEFIKRNGEFTVNIALIHKGSPVVGVVFAPELNCLYFASTQIGAWKQTIGDEAQPILVRKNLDISEAVRVVGSRSHQSEQLQDYLSRFNDYELVAMGSSLKLCLVAEGAADIYPRLGLTSEWDTAAAHAVVSAAGGHCINYETNTELKYNTKDSLLNPFFIVQGYKG